jgi:hypothetical protein
MFKKIKPLIIITYSLLLASCAPAGWKQLSPDNSPPASGQGAVAFMTSSNTAVMFGGLAGNYLNETWIWNGETWHQAFPKNSPPARVTLSMAYDASRDIVVLFGGVMDQTLFDDTWEWNGQNWQWMNPVHKPPARCCQAMAYDSENKNIVMYGGYDPNTKAFLGDVWKWDGVDWTEISCCNMAAMSGHAMVGFLARNEIISVQTGGQGTWSWDGKTWSSLKIQYPPSRSEGQIAYDSDHRWATFFAGIAGSELLNDT